MAAKLQRLILHVGPHKTGSTSLQYHLAKHRQTLLEQGLAVSKLKSLDGSPNHWFLVYVSCQDDARLATYHNSVRGRHDATACAKLRGQYRRQVEDELMQIRLIEPQRVKQAIYSSEEVAFLNQADWDHLYRLFLEHAETVEMFYYLRAPIDRLRSDIQQAVKGGGILTREIFAKIPNQDLLRVTAMEPATELQSKIRLHVRSYHEPQSGKACDVVADFLQVIGAQPPHGSDAPLAFNPSMSLELFSVLQDINRVMPAVGPQGNYNRLRHHLHDAIESYRWTKEDHAFNLSKQDVQELCSRQSDGLQQFLNFCREASWINLHEDCDQVQAMSPALKTIDIPGSALDYKPDLSRAYYVNLICHLWRHLREQEIKSKFRSGNLSA